VEVFITRDESARYEVIHHEYSREHFALRLSTLQRYVASILDSTYKHYTDIEAMWRTHGTHPLEKRHTGAPLIKKYFLSFDYLFLYLKILIRKE
jgi:hypothetical protein